jgi:hypothetical protein
MIRGLKLIILMNFLPLTGEDGLLFLSNWRDAPGSSKMPTT